MNLRWWVVVTLVTSLPALTPAHGVESGPARATAVATVESLEPEMIALADQVWEFAETALRELRSAELLAQFAEAEGFEVERGVAGMPTAFVASYGRGGPVIGIMGEYDALPGISQKATATKEPAVEGGAGHGCGHNLFGAASLGAAVAVKRLIEAGELDGTIRFYGTPAEEAVGGKVYMVREGLFDDVDVALAWHPSDWTSADTQSSQALVDFLAIFEGRTAHAAYDPWNGRSALDAAEIFTFALNQMREHVEPTVRMHYVIQEGGDVPNVVPDRAVVWTWLRDTDHTGVDRLLERARQMVEGAALTAGVEGELRVQAGDWEMLVNMTGARLIHRVMTALGPPRFSPADHAFGRELQRATGVEPVGIRDHIEPLDEDPGPPEGGSTDVSDVSWNVPTLHLSVATAPADVPWHAWPVVAASRSGIGYRGMTYAAKVLAATAVELIVDREVRAEIRREFDEQTAGTVYVPYIPEGPPPVPAEILEAAAP